MEDGPISQYDTDYVSEDDTADDPNEVPAPLSPHDSDFDDFDNGNAPTKKNTSGKVPNRGNRGIGEKRSGKSKRAND